MKTKSFKGKLADGAKTNIRLSTKQGLIGYKIKKFEIIPVNPATLKLESIVKLFSIDPSTIDGTVNFEDPTLLAVAYLAISDDGFNASPLITIFDNTTINQDIFVTHSEIKNSEPCNYYIELEQVKLSVDEAAVATLKDMRGRE